MEYKKYKKMDLAYSCLNRGIEINPDCEHVHFNYGAFLHEEGKLHEAVDLYQQVLTINPELPVCHYNLSACYFLLGDYQKGWQEYEWRWKYFPTFARVKDRFNPETYWHGEKCKRLFLYTEQGIGDTLMFVRYIKQTKERVEHITLECIPELIDILKTCEGIDKIYCNEPTPSFDAHCSLLTLPTVLGVNLTNISGKPYLKADATSWDSYKDKIKIGIVWMGSILHPNDKNRSCHLKYFKELHDLPNVKLFSLQKHYYVRDMDYNEGSEGMFIVDMKDYMSNFNYTAKIIQSLDLVIGVDTAVMHLAGALGKPVWLLLPYVPDWRWGLKGERTPWYNSMRLFRQECQGDWQGVFDRVCVEMNTLFQES